MKKEHQIIMLPSEKPSELCKCNCPVHNGRLTYNVEHKGSKDSVYEPQHLYILSDEEIKEGDYIYDSLNKIGKTTKHSDFIWMNKVDSIKKIIATTDAELNKVNDENKVDESWFRPIIPQIPQHVIEAYVKKPFDEVEVEYLTKLKKGTDLGYECNYIVPDKPKLNQDGTLAVSLVEEEMYSLYDMRKAFYAGMQRAHGDGKPVPEFDKWIKENF